MSTRHVPLMLALPSGFAAPAVTQPTTRIFVAAPSTFVPARIIWKSPLAVPSPKTATPCPNDPPLSATPPQTAPLGKTPEPAPVTSVAPASSVAPTAGDGAAAVIPVVGRAPTRRATARSAAPSDGPFGSARSRHFLLTV